MSIGGRNESSLNHSRSWSGNALKVQQQNRKQSWNAGRVSSAERAQANHQMQRERRDLKQRQKDAMQDMKDRQRSLKDMQRAYGQ